MLNSGLLDQVVRISLFFIRWSYTAVYTLFLVMSVTQKTMLPPLLSAAPLAHSYLRLMQFRSLHAAVGMGDWFSPVRKDRTYVSSRGAHARVMVVKMGTNSRSRRVTTHTVVMELSLQQNATLACGVFPFPEYTHLLGVIRCISNIAVVVRWTGCQDGRRQDT